MGSSVAKGKRSAPGDTILGWHPISLIFGEYLVFSFCLASNLIGTKNPLILRRRPFFFLFYFVHFLVSTCFWTKNPLILRRRPFFFFFVRHLFLDRKRVPPRNPAQGATILSNATEHGNMKALCVLVLKVVGHVIAILRAKNRTQSDPQCSSAIVQVHALLLLDVTQSVFHCLCYF